MAPNQTPSPGRRKRARPEDDLAPLPAPSPSTAAASAKRRRLNDVTDSPRSTPKGFSAISSAIDGALGRRGRRNQAHRKLVGELDGTTAESSYDVPASDGDDDDELERVSSRPKKLDYGILPKDSTTTGNLYDVPDSGDELEIPRATARRQEERNPVTPSKRWFVNGDAKSVSARATTAQRNGQGSKGALANNGAMTTPRRRGRPPKVRPTETEPPAFPLAVKARIYGPTGKKDFVVTAPDSPKLKGILSPNKKKPGRPAKTVAFGEVSEADSDIPKDDATPRPLPVPTLAKPRSQRENPILSRADRKKDLQEDPKGLEQGNEEEEKEEDEDEEVCVICSKPDSEPPNEIIFCEVCDSGFHQECYNVPVIPEGDWICRTCSQEHVLPDQSDVTKKKAVTTSTDIPTIPNFEQHFQKMRRVLLDRCSGNRRIKFCGQSEAFDKAYQLVEQTVVAGEGNSMMVIGGRGCGKTTVGLPSNGWLSSLTRIIDDGRSAFEPPS